MAYLVHNAVECDRMNRVCGRALFVELECARYPIRERALWGEGKDKTQRTRGNDAQTGEQVLRMQTVSPRHRIPPIAVSSVART